MEESNYTKIMGSTLPIQLANEHWDFLVRWLEMIYKDAFIHGYKHGQQSLPVDRPKEG